MEDVVMRSSELHYMSAVDALAAYRAGEVSPVELTRAVLDQVERHNERYNAYNACDSHRKEGKRGVQSSYVRVRERSANSSGCTMIQPTHITLTFGNDP
jgi:Asp-tRNA(Asn)/Glu-tRNA(Gln) amidotransferase A subunit family amidase